MSHTFLYNIGLMSFGVLGEQCLSNHCQFQIYYRDDPAFATQIRSFKRTHSFTCSQLSSTDYNQCREALCSNKDGKVYLVIQTLHTVIRSIKLSENWRQNIQFLESHCNGIVAWGYIYLLLLVTASWPVQSKAIIGSHS